jgi:hypothetical protein
MIGQEAGLFPPSSQTTVPMVAYSSAQEECCSRWDWYVRETSSSWSKLEFENDLCIGAARALQGPWARGRLNA